MNVPVPRSLVPPRPNLGPEPALDSSPLSGVWAAAGILAAAVLLLAVGAWIVLGRTRKRLKGVAPASQQPPDDTPRGQLVALSQSIRDALTTQFGTSWRAKTTEELSADRELAQVLGALPHEELIRFLDQIDRLKFAAEPKQTHLAALDDELVVWKPKVVGLVEKIRANANGAARRKSTENGASGAPKGRPLARPRRVG